MKVINLENIENNENQNIESVQNRIVIYTSKGKDYVKEYNKKRYQRDKEKVLGLMNSKCRCKICDSEVNFYHKQRHKRTKKHIKHSESSNLIDDKEIFELI
jgi:hypothetical protein